MEGRAGLMRVFSESVGLMTDSKPMASNQYPSTTGKWQWHQIWYLLIATHRERHTHPYITEKVHWRVGRSDIFTVMNNYHYLCLSKIANSCQRPNCHKSHPHGNFPPVARNWKCFCVGVLTVSTSGWPQGTQMANACNSNCEKPANANELRRQH